MNIIIVSGASGVGKSTIIRQFVERDPERYELVKSVTTREPRSDDDFYSFVTEAEFQSLLKKDFFLEANFYQGSKAYYGTPKSDVERILAEGKIPVLEIDINGKRAVASKAKRLNLEPYSIFIAASPKVIYERLKTRGDSYETIVPRLMASYKEIAAATEYDSIIFNSILNESVREIQNIIAGNKEATPCIDIRNYRSELLHLIQIITTEGSAWDD